MSFGRCLALAFCCMFKLVDSRNHNEMGVSWVISRINCEVFLFANILVDSSKAER